MNINVKKITSLVLAGTIAIGAHALSTSKAYAEGINSDTRIEQNENNESSLSTYIVKEGDNASKISRKICKEYGIEQTNKYWPVIAFLNDYPRIIHPGDEIVYPTDLEKTEELLAILKKTNWFSKYVQKNNIYGKKGSNSGVTVAELLDSVFEECYGVSTEGNEDLYNQYLFSIGVNENNHSELCDLNHVIGGDDLFNLTEYIPTLEEVLGCGKTLTR